MHFGLRVVDGFLNKLETPVDNFCRPRAIMRPAEVYEHFSSFVGIVESLRVAAGDEIVILSVNEADLPFGPQFT